MTDPVKRPADRYSPLYFLASLGAGGLAVTFFMYLMFWVPHKGRPVPVFEDLMTVFASGSAPLKFGVAAAMAGIAVFVVLNVRYLIWNFQALAAFKQTRAYAELRAAELMTHEAARLFDAGKPCGAEANMAKMLAAEASWKAGDTCLQTHGGFGFAREFDIERKLRETRLYQVAPISTNLILSYIGEHVLDMPRSF